jgi:O-acetyl-ADP-ribose deacetylase (regulator of RNase III)
MQQTSIARFFSAKPKQLQRSLTTVVRKSSNPSVGAGSVASSGVASAATTATTSSLKRVMIGETEESSGTTVVKRAHTIASSAVQRNPRADDKNDEGDDDTERLHDGVREVEEVAGEQRDRSASKLCASVAVNRVEIQVRHGDLCREDCTVLVNAANGSLAHGAGVAGALRRAGGDQFQRISDAWIDEHGTLDEGEVAVTGSGNGTLMCEHVVHAVGPIYRRDQHEQFVTLLGLAVRSSLEKAAELQARSIALPAISSGIFGGPKDVCARVMFDEAVDFARSRDTSVKQIRFTNFDRETVDVFLAESARRCSDDSDSDDDDDDDDDDEDEKK